MVEDTRLADDLGGGAEAKGSAGGNEPQSKLVKDIMSRQVEQEASRATKVEVSMWKKDGRLTFGVCGSCFCFCIIFFIGAGGRGEQRDFGCGGRQWYSPWQAKNDW